MALVAQWRATYRPGDWIVLAGPTSLVVLQPLESEWTALVDSLWQEVLRSGSMAQLADRLAAYGIADMPSFGALFWGRDGMRSLLRGGVVVRDVATGETVGDGLGVQTWNEIGLEHVDQVQIDTPGERGEGMDLPLVVGAVHACSLTLDATSAARVSSVQATGADEWGASLVEPAPHEPAPDEPGPDAGAETATLLDAGPEESDPADDADTQLMPTPGPMSPAAETEPAVEDEEPPLLARLLLSDGQTVDLDDVVRIGRAPSPGGVGGSPRLISVSSPNADVSRTHLEISPLDGRIVVTDLDSTNGTFLVRPLPESPPERLPPGQPVALPVGSLLDLGDGVSVLIESPNYTSA